MAWFPDDEACLRYLERLRWGDGFVCRFCGTVDGDWWQWPTGCVAARPAGRETSVTAGHDLRRHADAVGELVRGDLVRGQPEAGRLRARAAARARASAATRPRGRGCTSCVARWCSPAASCSRAPSRSTRATSAPRRAGQARSWRGRQGDRRDRRRGPRRSARARAHDDESPTSPRDTLTDFVLDHVARGARFAPTAGRATTTSAGTASARRHERVGQSGDPAHVVDAARAPRRLAAQALAAGHPPGRGHPRPARLLPRRVHLSLQPPPLTPPRAALLPPPRGCARPPIHTPTRRSLTARSAA